MVARRKGKRVRRTKKAMLPWVAFTRAKALGASKTKYETPWGGGFVKFHIQFNVTRR